LAISYIIQLLSSKSKPILFNSLINIPDDLSIYHSQFSNNADYATEAAGLTSGAGSATQYVYFDDNGRLKASGKSLVTSLANPNDDTFPTTKAVQTAINDSFAVNDAMMFKGTIGTGGTIAAYANIPLPYSAGYTYKIITAGTYAGKKAEVGDLLIAVKDGTSLLDENWTIVQTNVDGAVTVPTSGTVPVGNGKNLVYVDSSRQVKTSTENVGGINEPVYLKDGTLTSTGYSNWVHAVKDHGTNGWITVTTNKTDSNIEVYKHPTYTAYPNPQPSSD
jgi:hypothetical protein